MLFCILQDFYEIQYMYQEQRRGPDLYLDAKPKTTLFLNPVANPSSSVTAFGPFNTDHRVSRFPSSLDLCHYHRVPVPVVLIATCLGSSGQDTHTSSDTLAE